MRPSSPSLAGPVPQADGRTDPGPQARARDPGRVRWWEGRPCGAGRRRASEESGGRETASTWTREPGRESEGSPDWQRIGGRVLGRGLIGARKSVGDRGNSRHVDSGVETHVGGWRVGGRRSRLRSGSAEGEGGPPRRGRRGIGVWTGEPGSGSGRGQAYGNNRDVDRGREK